MWRCARSRSGLTTLANEKQKEQRDKASGKKKPKAASKPGLGGTKVSSRCVSIPNSFKSLVLLFNALLVLLLNHNIPGLIQALTRKLWTTLETTISCEDTSVVPSWILSIALDDLLPKNVFASALTTATSNHEL